MNKWIYGFLSLILITFSFYSLHSDEPVNTSNPDVQNFQKQLQYELARSQQYLEDTKKRATSRSYAPAYIDKVALQNAIVMQDVKTTIYNNFYNNPVNTDSEVRRLVIALMRKEMITEGDLAALQNAADQARAKMRQQQQQPVPANQYDRNPNQYQKHSGP